VERRASGHGDWMMATLMKFLAKRDRSDGSGRGIGAHLRAARRAFLRGSARHRQDVEGYKVLVESLFSSPVSIIAGGIAGVLTPVLCWYATGRAFFLDMSIVMGVVLLLRTMIVVAFRLEDRTKHGFAETRRWDALFFVGATVFSGLLGMISFYALVHTDSAAAHVTVVAATIAFASGYVARNAGRPYFVLLQLAVFCLPLSAGLLDAEDALYHPIGYFALFYVLNNAAITFSVYRNLIALGTLTKKSQRLASALKFRNITLDAALNNMSHGLAMFDSDLNLAVANQHFIDVFAGAEHLVRVGAPLERATSHLVSRAIVTPEQAKIIMNACRHVVATGRQCTVEVATSTGRSYVLSMAPVEDGGVVLLVEDATERKATAARLERMARFDELTGLANRFEFETLLGATCRKVADDGKPFCVHYVDLDRFKQVNDNLGHGAGDLVLSETARRLKIVAGDSNVVARFGGDEFLVIQRDATIAEAQIMSQRIVDALALPFDLNGKTFVVGASVGVAVAPDHGNTPADIMRHADIALYRAKEAGRGSSAVFSHEMARALMERHENEVELRKAFEAREIALHYQPIIDIKSGRVVAFEALLRWPHAERGMIPPSVFIPIAEQTGLIARMGEWAIIQACRDAMSWPTDVTVAVNVSPLQFRESHRLIQTVRRALADSGLSPGRLVLEVTESLLIEDQKTTLAAIRELRKLGIKLSLDDFGTGYSSLAYLATYPFTHVKIDRGFAKDVATSVSSRAIVEAVCQLAKRLGMQIVVEGIETEVQLQAITQIGADRAQGWLFGKPAPASATLDLFKKVA
jgi:diguanylate cyclase (GGDEF)-like protein